MGLFDLHEPEDGQDRFYLYAMIILPFFSSATYLFDSWYHYQNHTGERTYEGLLSTIVIVFSHLQYCAPIGSRKARAVFHISLCVLSLLGTLGYLLHYVHEKEVFQAVFYSCMMVLDVTYTTGLLYCRVKHDYKSNIVVENKHIFHFVSRLEVILTIFIPIYMNVKYTSLTRNVIAYFLLFDFFSDSYTSFQGIWIKGALYLFAMTTTVSVAAEWFYFNHHIVLYEKISLAAELVATVLCDSIIILQFFPFHFKTRFVQNIARQALLIHQNSKPAAVPLDVTITDAVDAMRDATVKIVDTLSDVNTKI
jgi:hypothetical protein